MMGYLPRRSTVADSHAARPMAPIAQFTAMRKLRVSCANVTCRLAVSNVK